MFVEQVTDDRNEKVMQAYYVLVQVLGGTGRAKAKNKNRLVSGGTERVTHSQVIQGETRKTKRDL